MTPRSFASLAAVGLTALLLTGCGTGSQDPAPTATVGTDAGALRSAGDSGVVELGGIEPPSNAVILRLLRAQSVKTFCSAPTFSTDTQVDGPSLERVPRDVQTPSRSKIPR